MKKTLRFLGAMALGLLMAPVLTSCGDDEPGEGAGNVQTPVYDGTRISSINNVPVRYDQQGRAVSFGSEFSIDYSTGRIYFDDADEEEGNVTVSFTDKGYISSIKSSWDYEDSYDGERYKGNATVQFSYDKDGHIVKLTETGKETGTGEGESSSYESNITISMTWKDGNLVKVVQDETEIEDGEKDQDRYVYDIDYGTQMNIFKQFPMSLANALSEDTSWHILASLGFLGIGPNRIPESMEENDDDGDSYSYTFSISLNDNGTINSEYVEHTIYYYGYSAVTKGMSASRISSKKTMRARDLFLFKSRRNNK